jgi:hypothetical protein
MRPASTSGAQDRDREMKIPAQFRPLTKVRSPMRCHEFPWTSQRLLD